MPHPSFSYYLPGFSVVFRFTVRAFSSPLSPISNPVRSLRLHPYQSLVPKVTPNLGYSTHCAVTLLTGLTIMFRAECSQHTFASLSKMQYPHLFIHQRNSSLGDTGSREVNHSSKSRDEDELLFATLSLEPYSMPSL